MDDNSNIVHSYPGSVKFHLQQLNFKSIPKHILGFSEDYTFTKRRIEEYLDNGGAAGCHQSWDSFSPLEQELFERNIQKLKQQQASLRGWDPSQATAAAALARKRKAHGQTTAGGGGGRLPFKMVKRGPMEDSSTDDTTSDDDDDDDEEEAAHADTARKNQGRWSGCDTALLRDAVKMYIGRNGKIQWPDISERVFKNRRSAGACRAQYLRYIEPSNNAAETDEWEQAEDDIIFELKRGHKSFAEIARHLKGRNSLNVQDRWRYLKTLPTPKATKKPRKAKAVNSISRRKNKGIFKFWTKEENKVFFRNLEKIKSNEGWPEILAQLPGRTKGAVTNRLSFLKRECRLSKEAGGLDSDDEESEDEVSSEMESPSVTVKLRSSSSGGSWEVVGASSEYSQGTVEDVAPLALQEGAVALPSSVSDAPWVGANSFSSSAGEDSTNSVI